MPTYTKITKPTAAFSKLVKPVASFISHIYDCLLCEDGSYLLQEDGVQRVVLEWYYTKVAKT